MHLLLLSSSAAPRRRSARLSVAAALSHARGSYCHHPHAVHTRASTKGHRQKSPDSPRSAENTLRFRFGTRFALGGHSRFDRSCRERVTAHGWLRRPDCWSGRTHAEPMDAVSAQRGVFTRVHLLLLIVGRAAPTLSAILCVRRRSLARARGSYCHHPHAVRTRASTKVVHR